MLQRIAVLLLLACALGALAQAPQETLYQVSTLNALMLGIYDGQMPVRTLLRHGDFGLGTFTGLDGEMLILDGTCYQIKSDGTVAKVDGAVTTPFAAVTTFNADQTWKVETPVSLTELEKRIDAALPTANWFYAIKVTGVFTLVKARSVPKQQAPYPPLVEVVKTQPVFQLPQVKGTLVGFRCPAFAAGVNVPGYHFHFLSEDARAGGHVLEAQLLAGTVSIDATPALLLALPSDDAFKRADLSTATAADVQKVEK
ncbi:MAG TPA: acetolactate decarboxylase [Armatimonadota bacterium]|nr:acetolactate decarboxylase [Armatimonadota bacterium]HOS43348.1 acetolactate decarboxylase [Armatimonadota bacterium]